MADRTEIIRVWGKADEFDIEFTHQGGTRWTCKVPPDTVDGQYAVELWAMNILGETTYWTGELFMCNGICHLNIFDAPYRIWLKPVFDALRICGQTKQVFIRKECPHGR